MLHRGTSLRRPPGPAVAARALRAFVPNSLEKQQDPPGITAGVDEQEIFDSLKLQALTRELLKHLTAMSASATCPPMSDGESAGPDAGEFIA